MAALQRELYWDRYHKHLRIEDRRTHHLVPYELNAVQRRLDGVMDTARLRDKPTRLIVLKSRRMGVSTHIQMRFAHLACTSRAFHGITGAHLDDASGYLHKMSETAVSALPDPLRPLKRTGIQGKRIEFEHGSSIRTFTAGGREGVGRATSANALHGSEVAFWPDAKTTLTALLQIVPDEPGTLVCLESTANGVGDEWHKRCQQAQNGDSDYQFFFAPWHEFPDYSLNEDRASTILGLEVEYTPRELLLHSQGVSRGQLAWRRWAIQNLCGGDASTFDQEYPDSPEVAFLTSGRPYFANELLDAFKPVEPIRVGEFAGSPVNGTGGFKYHADTQGPLRIWKAPTQGREYLIFGDPAGKVTLDSYDARPTGKRDDYCAAYVVDRETGEEVAEYHAHCDPDLFGDELAKLGLAYKGASVAMIAVEATGGYGAATLARLHRGLGYSNLYLRRALDTYSQAWTQKLGWETTQSTRVRMLDALRETLRDTPHLLKSDGLKREMRTFVVHSNGTPAAQSGAHDDRVMARAGACEIWREHAQRPVAATKKKQPRVMTQAERRPRVGAA